MDKMISTIVKEIKHAQYSSITDFARKKAKELKLSEHSICNTLSGGTVSFPVVRTIYKHLGLGSVSRKRVVRVEYTVEH